MGGKLISKLNIISKFSIGLQLIYYTFLLINYKTHSDVLMSRDVVIITSES